MKLIKRFITVGISAAMAVSSLPVFAAGDEYTLGESIQDTYAAASLNEVANGTCGDNLVWTLDNEGTLTISGSGAMSDGTSYGSFFNGYDDRILKIVIEDGVTSIGDYVFSSCGRVSEMTLPDSLTSIGASAFLGCSRLSKITIPAGVTSIGSDAFKNTAYYNNGENWDNGILYIGNALIKATSYIISGDISVKEGTRIIGGGAFSECSALSKITIPDSVTSIGESTFYNCGNLREITIPDSVTSIGRSTFYNCSSLSEITIPDGVANIEGYTFSGCSNLSKITIPAGVTSIGSDAFKNTAYYNNDENWDNGILYIGNALINAKSDIVSGDISVKEGTRIIGGGAFSGCSDLSEITLPAGVTSIGDYAFNDCRSLSKITLPAGVTNIGALAFWNCGSLSEIKLPDSVTSIGDFAFYNCGSLNEIDIPNSMTRIEDYVFEGCVSLSKITLPDSVTSIGDFAFRNCVSLGKITLPDSVTSIGKYAFYNCDKLSEIKMSDSVTSIKDAAFSGCNSLKDVYYKGNSSQWSEIAIGSKNECLTNADIHFEAIEHSPTYDVKITATKEVTENGNVKIDIRLSEPAVGKLIIAQYDESGRFLGLKKQETTENTTDYTEEMPDVENSLIMIMFWNSTSSVNAFTEKVIVK